MALLNFDDISVTRAQVIVSEVSQRGWVEIRGINNEADLLILASMIGTVIPHPNGDRIGLLKPSTGENRTKGTFRNVFGLGEFPLHTDTAFWRLPARYIILCSFGNSSSSTLLSPIHSLLLQRGIQDKETCDRAIFHLKTNSFSSYVPFKFKHGDEFGYRYDVTCMKPANASAQLVFDAMSQHKFEIQKANWFASKTIIIDNWHILHGREAVDPIESRELRRVYINKM